ncbi:hypothetical protein [Aneurinibacillus migulanus]|uniref:hypothetical protein n=1 Tax=Aneurinibacillus migulanus TaxID=47500 RepID=UPI000AA4BDFD|nr:hypothetical protein [Aneurinibacillus migulanus]
METPWYMGLIFSGFALLFLPSMFRFAFLLLERRAHPTSSFSESPPSNHATLSKYQV